jgi:hypothetical protein
MRQASNPYSPYSIDVPGGERFPARRVSSPEKTRPKGKTMRISDFCFLAAGLAALCGMTLGIVMGIAQDFTLAPAHAHLNLLGWVTMALYGLYHRSIGRTGGWLGWTQVLAGALGAVLMSGGLAIYLQTGDHGLAGLVVAGSLLAFLAMVLFVGIVVVDLLGLSPASRSQMG